MKSVHFKGLTLAQEPIFFSLKDVPVMISSGQLILAHQKKLPCPVIKYNSVLLGCNYYEGDKVVCRDTGKLLGYIIHQQGFKYLTTKHEIKTIPPFSHILVKEGDKMSISEVLEAKVNYHDRIVFKGKSMDFFGIMGSYDNKLLLSGYTEPIEPGEVHIYTGISDTNNYKLGYGETFHGYNILLRGNDVVAHKDFCCTKLEDLVERV